jgi:hypothetical protein
VKEQKLPEIILVGIGTDCVSIVDQAINELRDEIKIGAVVFDCDERYNELADKTYPQKTIEDLPGLFFDKLLICSRSYIMEESVKLFCEELNIPRSRCGSYITHKIGPHKIVWDQVKSKEDLVEQICFSEELNDLERFFYGGQHRTLNKWLHYFEIYERHFAKYRNKAPVVMEIGIFRGGSLQMWKDYFGKGAQIIGVDIDEKTKAFEEEQIHVEIGSQSDRNFLKQLKLKYPKIDILIDDGGHTMEQQITTFEEMFCHISVDGVYLCEDLHTSYWKEYGGGYKCPDSYIEYSKNFIDYLHAWFSYDPALQENRYSRSMHSLHYYDSVLVIEKGKVGPAVNLMLE